jgi:hypothetical protein
VRAAVRSVITTLVLVLSTVSAAHAETPCERRADLDTHRASIVLRLAGDAPVPAVVERRGVREAASIWARYGVDVRLDAPDCAMPDDAIVLMVVPGRHTGEPQVAALGALSFGGGVPGHVITIFYDDVLRFAEHRGVIGSPEPTCQGARRDQIAARVLGRVLAHEIGHFLLASESHAADGLMKSRQMGPDLCAGPAAHFLLSPPDVERLSQRLEARFVPPDARR